MSTVRSRALALGLVAAFVIPGGAEAQVPDQSVEFHDVSSLVESRRPAQLRSWSSPLRRPGAGQGRYGEWMGSPLSRAYLREEVRFMDEDQLVELIQMMGGEMWEEDGTAIGVMNASTLYSRNTPENLRSVQVLLDALRHIEGRRIRLEVDVLVLSSSAVRSLVGRGATTLDDEARQALLGLEGVRLLSSGTHDGPVGEMMSLVDRNWTAYVSDYDVEVAQKAWVADSLVSVLETGLEVAVRSCPRISGDGIQLEFTTDDVGRKASWRQAATSEDVGNVSLPSVSFSQAFSSVVVPKGHTAVVWSGNSTEGGFAYLVRPRIVDPPASDSAGSRWIGSGEFRLGVFPAHTLVSARADSALPSQFRNGVALVDPDSDMWGEDDEDRDPAWRLDEDFVIETLYENTGGQSWDEMGPSIFWSNGYLYVIQKAEHLVSVERLLQRLEKQVTAGSYSVTAELWMLTADSAKAIGSGTVSGESLQKMRTDGELVWAAQVSTLSGSTSQLVQGSEQSYLRDYDVEIAQESTLADPVIDSYLTGGCLEASVNVRGAGMIELRSRVQLARSEREPTRFDLDAPRLGTIELPQVQNTDIGGSTLMKPGTSVTLGQRTIGNKRLLVVVTVR